VLLRKLMEKIVKMTYSFNYVMILKSHKKFCTKLSELNINAKIWQPSSWCVCVCVGGGGGGGGLLHVGT
jgi:hypothetical protein